MFTRTLTDFDKWCAELFVAYPKAKLHQERLMSGGFAKVAFVGRRVVGKFVLGKSGWIERSL
jgi:hypothetical protein